MELEIGFNPLKVRRFYREGRQTQDFCALRVNAILGSNSSISCEIDSATGLINIPANATWARVNSREDARVLKKEIVQRFQLTVWTYADEGVIVAQRQGNSNTYANTAAVLQTQGNVIEYNLPQVGISYYEDATSGWEVWTKPMNREMSNRVDIWSVQSDGSILLDVIYVVTLDNGESFRVIRQQRWVGSVLRRKAGTHYQVPGNADSRAHEALKDKDVLDVMDRFVFVPGEHAEDFTSRIQILRDPEFRKLVNNLKGLDIWDDREDFWVERAPSVLLRREQAYVKFFTYGVGRASYGILKLTTPIQLFGQTHDSLQFDHHALRVEDPRFEDPFEQGIWEIPPGTLVEWREPVDMGTKPDGTPYPAKVRLVFPLYAPTANDAREVSTN
jgi:hypothetical protein